MNILLISIFALVGVCPVVGQGTVSFANGDSTLVSVGPAGQGTIITDPRDSCYFGLLIAAPGTLDTAAFTFSGIYATNWGPAFPGRLLGGLSAPVPGWQTGEFRSFFVAGWSASLGHDWQQQWMVGLFSAPGYFGVSSIATGMAGGPSGGVPQVPLDLFGLPSGIQTGFNLFPVPEPSTLALGGLGVVWLACRAKLTKK